MSSPKILAMRVDMMEGLGNNPELVVVLDSKPEDYRYTAYPLDEKPARGSVTGEVMQPTAYVGWSGGGKGPFAEHFTATGNQEGCARRRITLDMADGSQETIVGPWIGSQVIREHTGVDTVTVVYVVLGETEAPETLWQIKEDWMAGMRELPDQFIWDTAARQRLIERYIAADRLRSKHHTALYHPAAAGSIRREWDGSDEQIAFVAELLSWRRRLTIVADVQIDVAQEAMERLCPGFALYPYLWRPSDRGPRYPWWVPARKSRVVSTVPEPKQEGWWGFAAHDEHGYPKSRFYATVQELLCEHPVMIGLRHKRWQVSGRHEGRWEALSAKDQALVEAKLRRARGQVQKTGSASLDEVIGGMP